MIRIIVIASVVVIAVYLVVFAQTQNVWSATNSAGVVSAAGFLAVLVTVIRKPMPQLRRLLILSVSAMILAGTAFHWVVMYRMTHWQYDTLHLVHKVVHHGIALDNLRENGLRTLRNYYDGSSKSGSFREAFRRNAAFAKVDSGFAEINTDSEVRILLGAESDSEIVLIALSRIRIDGEDPGFKNPDGQTGAVQDRMIINKKGLEYDIQN